MNAIHDIGSQFTYLARANRVDKRSMREPEFLALCWAVWSIELFRWHPSIGAEYANKATKAGIVFA